MLPPLMHGSDKRFPRNPSPGPSRFRDDSRERPAPARESNDGRPRAGDRGDSRWSRPEGAPPASGPSSASPQKWRRPEDGDRGQSSNAGGQRPWRKPEGGAQEGGHRAPSRRAFTPGQSDGPRGPNANRRDDRPARGPGGPRPEGGGWNDNRDNRRDARPRRDGPPAPYQDRGEQRVPDHHEHAVDDTNPDATSDRFGRSDAYLDDTGRRPGTARKRTDHGGVRPGIEKRSAGAKVSMSAARALRCGHPWVFREAFTRAGVDFPFGSVIPVVDPEGYRIGWGLYDPEGVVALRMLSTSEEFTWDKIEIETRVDQALAYREQFCDEGYRGAQRLIHGEADGFPGIAVDQLGEYLLIYKYARCAESYLEILVPLLQEKLEPAGIYLQDRLRPVQAGDRRSPAFHVSGRPATAEIEVEEDGLKFLVDLTAPISPGLFLDLREGRRAMEKMVAGKSVLNLFSFTGAFGLRGIRGGATSVTNVDAAARSHAKCRLNLAASGLEPEACEALTGDVFKFLERFRDRGRTFDFVVVDPPPFSNVDGAIFSALKDWSQLMRCVAQVVSPGGVVMAVCNAAGLSDQDFLDAIGLGCNAVGRTPSLIAEYGLPADFPVIPAFSEGRYLKTKLLSLR